jgi:hypothetical protein
MVEASDHGYVLHTRRTHVTRYRIPVCLKSKCTDFLFNSTIDDARSHEREVQETMFATNMLLLPEVSFL